MLYKNKANLKLKIQKATQNRKGNYTKGRMSQKSGLFKIIVKK